MSKDSCKAAGTIFITFLKEINISGLEFGTLHLKEKTPLILSMLVISFHFKENSN